MLKKNKTIKKTSSYVNKKENNLKNFNKVLKTFSFLLLNIFKYLGK